MKPYSKKQFLTQLKNSTSSGDKSNFVTYLGELIAGKKFKHSYNIEFKKWRKAVDSSNWSCNDLVDAKLNYWWHGDFEENKLKLNLLSSNLKDAIESNNGCDVLYYSLRVLEWGDVYKGCTGYVLNQYQEGVLAEKIKTAVAILEDENNHIDKFDQKNLRMDSGLTKIYSLASDKSIILDSRVVAALSLIATRFFSEEQLKALKKIKAFACGTSNSSEKKRSQINNIKIFSPYLKPENQAHFNLVSNWMLQASIGKAKEINSKLFELWDVKNDVELLRAVEASLFMIGSDISKG